MAASNIAHLLNNIVILTVAVTYRCNSRCRHCQIPNPPIHGVVDVTLFTKLLQNLIPKGLNLTYIWGGEPLLEPETTYRLLGISRDNGIPTHLITNGFWGKDYREAVKVARKLKSSGLKIFEVSIDPFHQEWIPLDSAKNALKAAVEAGIEKVAYLGKYPDDPERPNDYQAKFKEIAAQIDIPGVELSRHPPAIILVGKALRDPDIARHISPKDEPFPSCPCVPPVNRLGIDPDGNLSCCEGLNIGTVEKYLNNEIDVGANPVLQAIIKNGPQGLADLGKMDIKQKQFTSPCHLCYEARRELQKKYPELVGPDCFYD